jgi:hypothetical protein
VRGFQFTAHPDAPRLAQLSLLGPASLSPDRLAETLARLFALLGPGRVGSPRSSNGHRPERFELTLYTPPPPPKVRSRPEPGRGLLAVRVLRPPVELEVITEERFPFAAEGSGTRSAVGSRQPGGSRERRMESAANQRKDAAYPIAQPTADGRLPTASSGWVAEGVQTLGRESGFYRPARWRQRPIEISTPIPPSVETRGVLAAREPQDHRARSAKPRVPRIQGRVRVASGPWELEERWWAEDRTERDYWDVELEDGALYRVYRDRRTERWFADGVYD